MALARTSGFIWRVSVVVPVAGFGMRCAAAILSQKACRHPIAHVRASVKPLERCFQITIQKSPKNTNQDALFGQYWQLLARIANHLFHMKFHTTRREDSYTIRILIPLIFSHRRNAGSGIRRSRKMDYLTAPFHRYSN
jgi:hypothetical protein